MSLKHFRQLTFCFVLCWFGGTFSNPLQAQDITITVTSSTATVQSGVPFSYILRYQCNSITAFCKDVKFSAVLPAALDGNPNNVLVYGDPLTTAMGYDPTTRTVSWTMVNPMPPGSTGELEFRVLYPNGSTPNGTSAAPTVMGTSSNATFNTPTVPPVTATATGSLNVQKYLNGPSVALDNPFNFLLYFGNTSPSPGGLNFTNTTLTDVLPTGVTALSVSSGWTFSQAGNTVTISPTDPSSASVAVGQNNYIVLVCILPSGSGYTIGNQLTNTFTVLATTVGGGTLTQTAQAPFSIAAPDCTFEPSDWTAKFQVTPQDLGPDGNPPSPDLYILNGAFQNKGNVPGGFDLIYAVPPQFTPTALFMQYNGVGTNLTRRIYYQTNLNASWQNYDSDPTNTSIWGLPTLATGEYITNVRYQATDMAPNSYFGGMGFRYYVPKIDHNGNPVTTGEVIPVSYSYASGCGSGNPGDPGGSGYTPPTYTTGAHTFTVVGPINQANASKLVSPSYAKPGDIVEYALQLDANENVSTTPIPAGATVADLLPAGLDYVAGSAIAKDDPTGNQQPLEPTVISNYNGTGRTLLRWTNWPYQLSYTCCPVNIVTFNVKVQAGTTAGIVSNKWILYSPAMPILADAPSTTLTEGDPSLTNGTPIDFTGDGTTNQTVLQSTQADLTIGELTALESYKYVKGSLDAIETRYPNSGKTTRGGTANYRLVVRNLGNVPVNNIKVYDILPYIGDKAVIGSQDRLTQWRPNLTSTVSFTLSIPASSTSNITIYYSQQQNPCRSEVYSASGCVTDWTTTPPADLATVQALKFDFGTTTMAGGDSIQLFWQMRAPIDAPAGGEIAWNSFAYAVSRADGGGDLNPTEPIKVGIAVEPPPASGSIGDYVWKDANRNGTQDTGEVGVNGIKVEIFTTAGASVTDVTGQIVQPTYTSNNSSGLPGYYSFVLLPAGTYQVKFSSIPTDCVIGGGTVTVPINTTTGQTSSVTLSTGENRTDVDARLIPAAQPCALQATVIPGNCIPATNQYSVSGIISLTNTTGGTATLTDGTASTTVTIPANATSVAYSLAGLVSGTGSHTLTVSLPGCGTTTTTYTAPASCSVAPICSISATAQATCQNNGSINDGSDDYIAVLLTPYSALAGSAFTLSATQNGSPISLSLADGTAFSSLSYGYPTPLRTAIGTAGKGAIVLTLTDVNNATCTTQITLADPGTCTANACVGATPQTITYTYRTPFQFTDLNSVALNLPQFNDPTKTLTKVELSYGILEGTNLLLENTAATPVTYKATITSDVSFELGTTTLLSPSLSYSTGAISLPAGITVTAQGAYGGDLNYSSGPNVSTLEGMKSWLSSFMTDIFVDPRTDPRWVTNATGNAAYDDDIFVMTPQTLTATGATSYTATADLSPFIGSGNVPLTVSTLNGLSSSGGGGNVVAWQNTKAYGYATVVYTYTCNTSMAVTAQPGPCVSATNSYSVSGSLSLTNAVAGTATITDGTASTTVAITTGDTNVPFALAGLPSGTGSHTLTVSYSGKTTSTTYTAPASCTIAVALTVTPGVCNSATNQYSISGTLSLTNAVAGTATITDGTSTTTVAVAAGATSVAYSLVGFNSDARSHTVTVSYAGQTASATYTAPSACTLGVAFVVTPGTCNSATNQYSISGTLSLTNAPAGTATFTDGTSSTTVAVAAGATSVPFSLTGLTSGTGSHTVTASFNGQTQTYTAPSACTIAVALTVTPGTCNTATNQYSISGTLSLTNAVAGTATITDGTSTTTVAVAAGATSVAYRLSGFTSDASSHTVTVSYAGKTASATYTAPSACTLGVAFVVTPGTCNSATNQYSISGTLSLTNAPAGTATFTDGTSSTTVAVTAGATSVPFSLTGLPSGTGSHMVTASFNGQTQTQTYTAPSACTIAVALTVTPGTCNSATNQYNISGTLSLTNAVAGTATITDGSSTTTVAVAAGATSVAYSLSGFTSDASSHTVTVSYAGQTASATYTAPSACTLGVAFVVTPGTCQSATNQYSISGTLSLTNAPAGTATFTDGTSSTTVAVAAGASSVPFSLTGLPSGTGSHTVTASFNGQTQTQTYTAPSACTQPLLTLDKVVDKSRAKQGDTLTYRITLRNVGSATASNVIIRDSTIVGLTYMEGSASQPTGVTFTHGTPVSTWAVATLSAGQSLTLSFQARADSTGILYNTASIPGDTARACTSVPVRMCQGSVYDFLLSSSAGHTSYQWYKNGVAITGATSYTLSVSAPGTYSLAVNNQTGHCADFSCCPFIIEEDTLPTFQAKAIPVTCIGSTTLANGQLVLSNFRPGYTYQYSLGSTFNAAASLSGAAKGIPANGVLVGTLSNPTTSQTYTIRVYNSNGCYTDQTVILITTVCSCPPSVCVPFVITKVKLPK